MRSEAAFLFAPIAPKESLCIIIFSPPTKTKTIQTMASKANHRSKRKRSKSNDRRKAGAPHPKKGDTAPTAAGRLAEEAREGTVAELK